MTAIQADLINIKSKMPILITEQGVIIDSPQSAEARGKLKDQLKSEIAELHIRVRLLEEHDMQRRGK